MSGAFEKTAKKRDKVSKRPRDPHSGRFEDVSPLNSPQLRDQCVRWSRSMQELIPLLKALAQGEASESRLGMWAGLTASTFESIRKDILRELSFDSEALADAKRTWTTAPRRLPRDGGRS